MGWLQYLHKTTSFVPLLALGHLWSSYRIWLTQKYCPQKLHFIGRISLCLQKEQCSPKSSNSISGKKNRKILVKQQHSFRVRRYTGSFEEKSIGSTETNSFQMLHISIKTL